MQLSHLNGWRAVQAVLRYGSTEPAAKALGVTEAAVTAQIRRLEERLGQTLFDRDRTGLTATPALMAVAPSLIASFDSLSAVHQALQTDLNDGRVVLTVTMTFAEFWLPRHLPDLYADKGPLELSIDTSWDVVDLKQSHHHFAIRYMGPPDPSFCAVDLLPSGVVPVCTPNFAQRYNLSSRTRSLESVPLIGVDVVTSDPNWADWPRWSAKTGVAIPTPISEHQLSFDGSGSRIALAGIGLVLAGVSEVLHEISAGNLVMPFGPETVVPGDFWHRLIWLKSKRLGPAQRRVKKWIVTKAEEDRSKIKALFGI